MVRKVNVVPHNPNWAAQYKIEADRIWAALNSEIINIHHIGSTAIPGISAKPVLDLLIEVISLERIDQLDEVMIALGYKPKGEFGVPRRRFFTKNDARRIRTHHLHMFELGDSELARHLNFRDYMIAHRAEAKRYSQLKEKLAAQFPDDMDAYIAGKDVFIKACDHRAKIWRAAADT